MSYSKDNTIQKKFIKVVVTKMKIKFETNKILEEINI